MDENAGERAKTRNAAWPQGQTRKKLLKGLWSALQTHLQGVDWATLAVMIVMKNSHSRGPPFSVERRQITVASEASSPRPWVVAR